MKNMYEVEVKSLLGSSDIADAVRLRMMQLDSSCAMQSRNTQRNHYFIGGDLQMLATNLASVLSPDAAKRLASIVPDANEASVRSRQKDSSILMVLKISVDNTTSSNGIARMEFEEPVSCTLAELDEIILSAGFAYQAKWSREREEYVCLGTNITLDRNAGYGWLAEFERMTDSPDSIADAKIQINSLMRQLGVQELTQDRLARMFEFYNSHWQEYYGTDNIFTVE